MIANPDVLEGPGWNGHWGPIHREGLRRLANDTVVFVNPINLGDSRYDFCVSVAAVAAGFLWLVGNGYKEFAKISLETFDRMLPVEKAELPFAVPQLLDTTRDVWESSRETEEEIYNSGTWEDVHGRDHKHIVSKKGDLIKNYYWDSERGSSVSFSVVTGGSPELWVSQHVTAKSI